MESDDAAFEDGVIADHCVFEGLKLLLVVAWELPWQGFQNFPKASCAVGK
jgi:hypothetical protein